MKPVRNICLMIMLIALMASGAGVSGCGGEDEKPAATAVAPSPQDKAARLAAQAQLTTAQAAQESYFSQNQTYASTLDELKQANPRLNDRIAVNRGDDDGYEITITASDSAGTVYIIRKSGSRIERRDGDGNSW